jgi:hypothetical protein
MTMKIIRSRFFVILILVFFPGIAKSQITLKFPYIQKNVCPFECCRYGTWITMSPLKIYSNEGDTTKVRFSIAPGDSFVAMYGNVHMMKPGIVVVTKPVFSFSAGDTLYTLSYHGEGFIDVWHNGILENIEMFWDNPSDSGSGKTLKSPGILKSKALMIWWVRITSEDGRNGWLRLVNTSEYGFHINERIEGMDACG